MRLHSVVQKIRLFQQNRSDAARQYLGETFPLRATIVRPIISNHQVSANENVGALTIQSGSQVIRNDTKPEMRKNCQGIS